METMTSVVRDLPVIYLGFVGSLAAGLLTGVGALPVFFIRNVPHRTQNLMLGFGAGVMLAATAFSLVVPGIDAAYERLSNKSLAALVVALGMLIGGLCLWTANHHFAERRFVKGPYSVAAQSLQRAWLFIIAITLHNFPEGLAVGVGFGTGDIGNGITLAVAIGLQNMPEGLAVALALLAGGYSTGRAFLVALLSGMVEPVGGVLGAGIVSLVAPLLPWGLAFAAGAMLFVISQEVIPEIHRRKTESINTFGLLVGFVVMMMLDVILG